MWRVDTYRAFSATQDVREKQDVLKDDYINTLFRCIEAVAPGATGNACQELCREAVEASVGLAHEMQLSTAMYHRSSLADSTSGPMLLYGREMQKYNFVDVKTGHMLKRSAIKEHRKDMIIGEKLRNVFPALCRKSPKDDHKLVLVKETILVHIHDEFRQQKQKRT